MRHAWLIVMGQRSFHCRLQLEGTVRLKYVIYFLANPTALIFHFFFFNTKESFLSFMLRAITMLIGSSVSGAKASLPCSLGKTHLEHIIPSKSCRIVVNASRFLSSFDAAGSRMAGVGPSTHVTTRAFQFNEPNAPAASVDSIGEIEFDPLIANSISVIGNVGNDPELRYLENGNRVANWRLGIKSKKEGDTQWLNIEAWGPLAESAKSEIKRGQQICVQGRLRIRSWTTAQGQPRSDIGITANALNRVRPTAGNGYTEQQQRRQSFQSEVQQDFTRESIHDRGTYGVGQQGASAGAHQQTIGQNLTTEEMWMSFFEDTAGWYDNRPGKASGKLNAKSPDFKRKEGGRDAPALWIDSRTTPAWVHQELRKLDQLANDIPPF